jgi:hypothetical protein|tara:strand:+ start:133 stop:369 length:237 start_codon:yes stop_codon:yes gene_type:complete
MNRTLYKKLEDICAREYIINKLSANKFRTFVDFLYDDIRTWDKPMNVSEVDIIHRIEEHVSYMVSSFLNKSYEGISVD